ncbi:hypothetical protein HaLaN_18151 [Haematococcus lacustris]|uniref:Uncharacterized protein n=1 Tax=Haematococcus lacustris TaxID=44745 RepID=A0A699ZY63_HAELA|nr:hypothetical protein HaLaN_18151 [Haematococcus lacustris]
MGQKYGPRTGGRTLVPSGQVGVAPGKSAIDVGHNTHTQRYQNIHGSTGLRGWEVEPKIFLSLKCTTSAVVGSGSWPSAVLSSTCGLSSSE